MAPLLMLCSCHSLAPSYAQWYGESLTRHSWFQPISACCVLGKRLLHACPASVNRIGCARCLNKRYCYGAHGMHYHILLRQYSQNYYEKDYSRCHKDACVQISIGNTKCLLSYKGASYSCSSSEKACFHRKCWLGETPLGLSSQPSIDMYCTTTINQATTTRAPSQYKDHLSRYGDSHVKDKMVARLSYL